MKRSRTCSLSVLRLAHLHGRGGEAVEDRDAIVAEASEAEDAGGALLHAGRAADAFGVFHGHAFVGEVHHVDALMADAGADVAGDALFLFRKNPVAREARVDVHERGERAREAAPHAPAKPEIGGDSHDAGEPEIDQVGIVKDGPAIEQAVVDAI